jgi:hypothetical protein
MVTVHPMEDTTGLVRNPAMGWALYIEPGGKLPDAADYWHRVDPYVKFASILYLRLPWSIMEPEEGKYAWQSNPNYRQLIQGARDRGLQLAFRVVTNSRDSGVSNSPRFVRDAGAGGYMEQGQQKQPLWTPSVMDPIFRAKLEAFVSAFAKEYDDPQRVAFIDGGGLGWWGEMHHLRIPPQGHAELYNWICGVYSRHFHHVLLGMQLHSELSDGGVLDDSIALGRYGYVARMDSLGGFWLNQDARAELKRLYPATPFYGESCYFGLRAWDKWKNGPEKYTQPVQVLRATMKDALDCHANTLDLRGPGDAKTWAEEAPDLVEEFIRKGGYRFVPTEIQYASALDQRRGLVVAQQWKNVGVGVFPNDNMRWNHKYKVAFALLDAGGKVAAVAVDPQTEPARWTAAPSQSKPVALRFDHTVPAGPFTLGLAIVDTTAANAPAIQLAVTGLKKLNGWYVLGSVEVEP